METISLLLSLLFAVQEEPLKVQVDGSKKTPISPYVYGVNHPR